MSTWIALEKYNNNDQQFNRHDFLIKLNLSIDFLMTRFIVNVNVC